MSASADVDRREFTYGDNLSANEGERGLCQDGEPAEELALCARDLVVLHERTRILPVAEAYPVVVWATAEIEDDAEDDQAGDSDDFNRSARKMSDRSRVKLRNLMTYAKMNSHSPYTPAPNMLIVITTTRHIVIHTALLTD